MKIVQMKRLLESQLDLWERARECGCDDIERNAIISYALAELHKAIGPKEPRAIAAKRSRYRNVYWNEAKQAWVGRVVVKGALFTFGGSKDEDRTWQTFLAGLEREGHGAIAMALVKKAGLGDREIGR